MQPNNNQPEQLATNPTPEPAPSPAVQVNPAPSSPARERHPLALIGGMFFVLAGSLIFLFSAYITFMWVITSPSTTSNLPLWLLSTLGLGTVASVAGAVLLTSKKLTYVSKQTAKQRQVTGLALLVLSAIAGLYAFSRDTLLGSNLAWFAMILFAVSCGLYGIIRASGNNKSK